MRDQQIIERERVKTVVERGIHSEKGVFWQYTIIDLFSLPFNKCKTWQYTAESWAAPFSHFLFLFFHTTSLSYLLHSSISITTEKHPQFFL